MQFARISVPRLNLVKRLGSPAPFQRTDLVEGSKLHSTRVRRHRRSGITMQCLTFFLIASCQIPEPKSAGPSVEPVGQWSLQETDSIHLARPGQMAASAHLDLAITDQFHQRVLFFDSLGRLTKTVGNKGSGPGEFRMIGEPIFLDSGTLAVFDDSRRVAQIFSIDTGRMMGAFPTGPSAHSSILAGDTLFFGSTNVEAGTLAARRTLGDSGLWLFGSRPSAYDAFPALGGIYGLISLTRGRDGIVLGVPGLDSIYLLSSVDGARLGQAWIPAVRRRPAATSVEELHKIFGVPRDPTEIWQATSFLMGMHTLSTGETLVLHMDQDLQGQAISSRPFVSLISADLRRACLDTLIPLESDSRIVHAFHGDDVLFLTQTADQGPVLTQVHRYRVSSDGCTWRDL